MDVLIKGLLDLGPTGALCGVLFYLVVIMQRKLFSIVENNTKAMTELKGVIDKCQVIHRA
jgi:hypothetical protein